MDYDISESVSQRGDGAYDEENRRIQEVSDELQRLCRLHEEKSGNGKANGNRFEIEQRVAEQYAKEHGMWIPMDNVFDFCFKLVVINLLRTVHDESCGFLLVNESPLQSKGYVDP